MTATSTEVQKLIPLQLDLGNLAAFDLDPLDETISSCEKEQRESILASLTRSNLQILTNALFTLPTTDSDVGPLAALPRPSTALPREKRLPKTGEDAMTRWEKFAKAKGIHKRKRSAMEWDENSGEWIPRHGGRTRQNRRDDLGDWCEEVKEEEPKAKEKRKK